MAGDFDGIGVVGHRSYRVQSRLIICLTEQASLRAIFVFVPPSRLRRESRDDAVNLPLVFALI